MRVNCINCGAAIEYSATKCPFCGTSYFDFTHIDFNTEDPVAVKFKTSDNCVFSCLAHPYLDEISIEDNSVVVKDSFNKPLVMLNCQRSGKANIHFEMIPQGDSRILYTVQLP